MPANIAITLRFVDGRAVSSRAECRIRATSDATSQALTMRAGVFVGTVPIAAGPNGSASFVVSMSGQEFWDGEVSFSVVFVSGRPLILVGNSLSPRQVATGSLAGGLDLSLDVIVLRLRDVTTRISPHIAPEFEVFDLAPNVLGPFAAPSAPPSLSLLANSQKVSIDNASLRFFEWKFGHATIGVYVPTSAKPVTGTYIFYFKPPKHAGFSVHEVAEIYLSDAAMTDHQMLANCELARSEAVFCFLFGESGNPEVIANGAVLSDVLAEIDLVVRQAELSIAPAGVQSVALASFSEGGRLLNNVLGSMAGSKLASVLDGLFVFDSWFGEGQLEPFRRRINAWFSSGADGKVLRIYQGITVTDPDILAGQPGPHISGPDGTQQKSVGDTDTPDYYYLKMTDPFMTHRARRMVPPNDLHHAVPKLFLVHAIKTTSF